MGQCVRSAGNVIPKDSEEDPALKQMVETALAVPDRALVRPEGRIDQ
jgi:hypothetical protein